LRAASGKIDISPNPTADVMQTKLHLIINSTFDVILFDAARTQLSRITRLMERLKFSCLLFIISSFGFECRISQHILLATRRVRSEIREKYQHRYLRGVFSALLNCFV
jgi:hypothetical protein